MSLLANRYVLFISGECEVCLLSVRDVYEPCVGYYFCGKKIKHSLLKTNLVAISFFYPFFALLIENGFSGSCVNIPVKSVDETLAFSSVLLTHVYPLLTYYHRTQCHVYCLFKDLLKNILLPLTCTFLFHHGNYFSS